MIAIQGSGPDFTSHSCKSVQPDLMLLCVQHLLGSIIKGMSPR